MSSCNQESPGVEYRIVGYGRTKTYRVGSDGTSWCSVDGVQWRKLNPSPSSNGYPMLWLDRRSKIVLFVHVAVLSSFTGPAPGPDHYCCHKDGDKRNNRISNLYWGTQAENMGDMVRHGTSTRGERHPRAKLTDQQVREIVGLLGQVPRAEIARRFGIRPWHVSQINTGRSWSHVTGRPAYRQTPRKRRRRAVESPADVA